MNRSKMIDQIATRVLRTDGADAERKFRADARAIGTAQLERLANQPQPALTSARRDEMTAELRELCIAAGVDGLALVEQERYLGAQSDAGFLGYVGAAMKARRDQIERNASERAAAKVKEYSQVTAADREQAAAELEVYYAGRYASPHAMRADEARGVLGVAMRASSLARQRAARADADVKTLSAPPRVAQPDDVDDPFDPLANGVGAWASPPPGHKKGAR